MTYRDKLAKYAEFARFCINTGLDPDDVADLCAIYHNYRRVEEERQFDDSQEMKGKSRKYRDALTKKMENMGITNVSWSGWTFTFDTEKRKQNTLPDIR